MISRSGTFTSGALAAVEKILREEGRGPVVTAGRVVSGLERMFMESSVNCCHSGRSAERGSIRNLEVVARDSGFTLRVPRNDARGNFIMRPPHFVPATAAPGH